MPKYEYVAKSIHGKKIKGIQQALDEVELSELLKEDNLYLLSAKEQTKKQKSKEMKAKELADFCRQLGTLLGSGVTLVRALAIMIEEEGLKPAERAIYANLLRMVRQGTPLSEAMEAQDGVFPYLLIHMIHTAEVSGSMDKICMRMSEQFEKEHKLNAKVQSAMTYPKLLVVLIVAVVIILMAYVIPQFEELFAEMETLPIATELLLMISEFVKTNWLALMVVLAVVLFVGQLFKRVPKVAWYIDRTKIRMPLLGKLQKRVYTARFARTLCSLYGSGMPIITCLSTSRKTIGNVYIESQFDELIAGIRAGGTLSEGLDRIEGFTKKLVSSIRIGEETGHLESMLESTADTLDYEAEMAINQMVSYLEPLMIVIMACIVGFVMIAVIMPIYGSYGSIAGTDI